MTACDTCPKPGACCQGFTLTHVNGDWVGSREGFEDDATVNAYFESEGLPFVVRDRLEGGGARVACPWLSPEGRCSNYDQRPNICRNYPPEHNSLCALGPDFDKRSDFHLLGPENYVKHEHPVITDEEWAEKYQKLFGDRDKTPTYFPEDSNAFGEPGSMADE